MLDFLFEDGEEEGVIEELLPYQNNDGGFGNGIEPDMQLKASSPFATTVALQYCQEIALDAKHPIIEGAIGYLVSTYDSENQYWPYSSKEVNREPHAPWWHVEELKSPDEVSWPNPSAEILGYLHQYSMHVPRGFLGPVDERARENLESSETIESWLYNVMCWERAWSSLDDPLRSMAQEKILKTFRHMKAISQEALGEIRIFWLAPRRDSLLPQVSPEKVRRLLQEEIQNQRDDGGWWPTWEWGQYEEVWPIAEREWAGKMTVDCLLTLDSFGMIEK
jgi:hypothetical protein